MTQTNPKNNPSSSILKEARLAKGLSLDVVHEATKIPMDALRAIEDGYSTKILTPFYYRGFIKIYSDFLGLNVTEVLKEYKVQESFAKSTAIKPGQSGSKKTAQPKVPAGPSAFEVMGDAIKSVLTPKNQKNLLRLAGAVFAIFILVKCVGCVADFIKSRPKNPKSNVAEQKQNNKKAQVKKEQVNDESDTEEESGENTISTKDAKEGIFAAINRKVTLAVHANRDSWIQVKTDGKIAFQMTMKKGTMENWEAKNEIELSGKNLGDLNLEVNGKNVSPIGSFNRRAKKVLINKDGLTVKK